MTKPKRTQKEEFPDLKLPKFSSSSRKSIGRESDPLANSKRGGIGTDWEDIKWTPTKIVAVSVSLALPYLILMLVTYVLGMKIITAILLGIIILMIVLFVFVRWIDKA
jgi:hypothetical protein